MRRTCPDARPQAPPRRLRTGRWQLQSRALMTGGVGSTSMGHTADGGRHQAWATRAYPRPPSRPRPWRADIKFPTMDGSCADASRTGRVQSDASRSHASTDCHGKTRHATRSRDEQLPQGHTPSGADRTVAGHPPKKATSHHVPLRKCEDGTCDTEDISDRSNRSSSRVSSLKVAQPHGTAGTTQGRTGDLSNSIQADRDNEH